MIEALCEPITAILDSICSVIEHTPPELVGDILQYGMTLTGGGSRLHGLDRLIERVTGIPTYRSKEPTDGAALGAGRLLPYIGSMPEGMVTLPSRVSRSSGSGSRSSDGDRRPGDSRHSDSRDRRSGDRPSY